ncbi:SDR family NAD(P)-dependent oxidoreductase [Candidatus Magnetominusculus xianensis]|uniref:3-oxoacyl-[acyl-carrier-protein] reductase n=1 Tax=Candidatus Magnetominusculus xianensis TaxID=1748249 RepID=A0ABR5SGF9_9BACT|nr:SDR family oxidoreductase [Candidatus Magnetominusculus xianensis]KWT84135.1 3-oxoacyl-[acyl-carrier-protein] reductase [Candidatus Magnetominusculus xianensis]MBF0402428.1 SDR family oxidoreductase [Nitrospirota bacterium]
MSVSLVTGASGGIGRAICQKLLQHNSDVIAHYYSADEKFIEYFISAPVFAVKADLRNKDDIENLSKLIETRFGHIDHVINAAGVTADELLIKCPESSWDEVIDVNLSACFRVIRAMLPLFVVAGGGHIVNISSRSALRGTAGQCAYSASKAALLGLTVSLAQELAPQNIRVNAVMPGYVETPMGLSNPKALARAKSSSVLNTLSDADEAAELIWFILNTKTVTGQFFTLDSRLT